MKRIASIVIVSMLLMMISGMSVVFAEDGALKLTDSNPEDGYEKVYSQNVLIKLNFNEAIAGDETREANAGVFAVETKKGKALDFDILYNSKDSNNVNLLIKDNLKDSTAYVVRIDGSMQSDSGDTLGTEQTIRFRTAKPASGAAYFLLMAAMIVVMVFMSVRDARKQAEEEKERSRDPGIERNPYKVAKEKGISVDEASRLIRKELEKAEKKAARHRDSESRALEESPKQKETQKKKKEKKKYRVSTRRSVTRDLSRISAVQREKRRKQAMASRNDGSRSGKKKSNNSKKKKK